MSTNTEVEVLIVGLGPVGAALANVLGGYGVKVLAIDVAAEIFPKPRAIAFDNEALRILQLMGIKEGELDVVAIPQVKYFSPIFGQFARVNSSGIINGHNMVVTFYQPQLEKLLREKLNGYSNVEVRLETELVEFKDLGDSVTATLKSKDGSTYQVSTKFLVGADGSNSPIRKALKLDFEGQSYPEDWLIVDASRVPRPLDYIEFICDPRRSIPHMPAPGGRQRWEFKLNPGETREEMEKPEKVKELLKYWCDPDQIEIERTAVYRFHAREAKTFSKGRCFLVGDAAHITPPFAGQGLVAGLRDTANLGWKLTWVLQGKASPAILDSYDVERRPHAIKIINLARFLGAVIMPSSYFRAFAIHGAITFLSAVVPGVRSLFEELKIKPENTFDDGLFHRPKRGERLRPGSTFPQGFVKVPGGNPILSDDALGNGVSLVGFGVHPSQHLSRKQLEQWNQAGGKVWQWTQRNQALNLGPQEERFEALDEAVVPKEVPLGWLAIVRPDRCVMLEGPVEDASAMVEKALQLLAGVKPEPEPVSRAKLVRGIAFALLLVLGIRASGRGGSIVDSVSRVLAQTRKAVGL